MNLHVESLIRKYFISLYLMFDARAIKADVMKVSPIIGVVIRQWVLFK